MNLINEPDIMAVIEGWNNFLKYRTRKLAGSYLYINRKALNE
jgi:hypothetical protein